ncbi:VOC family protein [Kribbella sp. NPDC023855]|uniref:VOC family protein n=1 Tax=Kribbella sp. NPDC023855 TaxID=3154698 RepID=UPI0033F88314
MSEMELDSTSDGADDWRVVGDSLSAWFEATSQSAGAELVARIAELTDGNGFPELDLRATGVRVRLSPGPTPRADGGRARLSPESADLELARAISVAARELGLGADPSVLRTLRFAFDAADPTPVRSFWQTVLAYEPPVPAADAVEPGELVDPSRRDPTVSFHQLDDSRPLRQRIHVDIVRPAEAVAGVKASLGLEAYGAYGLTLADADGNEVDLVPGGGLTDSPETADWLTLFGAMTFYPTTSPTQASALATAVATLADAAGQPLLVDIRPAGVTIDSGKDEWEYDVPGFGQLAAQVQAAAHALDLTADPTNLRFVQFGIDAVDIPAVRAFWQALLGYEPDRREFLSDIYDPRRLNSVLFFQPLDGSDVARRKQRNRLRFELLVPHDQVETRVATALAAGGKLLPDKGSGTRILADPEGNEVGIRTLTG